jgi:hypothetical protein
MRRITLSALLALSLAAVPGDATAAEPETTEPAFCESQTLHDYLAPLKQMPELREPPFRATGRFFRFRGVTIAASGPALAVSGGRAGYQLNWDTNPKWDVTVNLARVDWRGRFMWQIGWRHLRLGELGAALTAEPSIGLPRKPGAYRTIIVIRSPSGRKLAEFGNHYRVVRPTVHARLALSSPAYSPGAILFARVENPGAAFALFGEEYAIEKLEGESWVRAPESPGAFIMPLYFVAPGKTSGHCSVFPIPASTPPGRYRISQEVVFGWPRQPRDNEPRPTLYAEFDLVP